ncbi:type VI secretion system baseplate subunit TssG [Vibrio harveyi]|uniref:type VI secretion system baseplate subunit TssG n=2 Tax=Vibrio harveyi TaxID=669 RepID=UPI001EFDA006|nr:type VI secretion system baseplate subunit TssG [Vibrio harveyi]EKO3782404.1 type VI secretion system baseplate subunit TssG [Vibrio harveyi]EKY4193285.1 type VI secretion system baseplate subunit TssG [Vibrio harveyi]ELH7808731.1 type VI secretion system baseplate subunit TssG [Vibrio harveyi]ELV8723394.1 type VI secretion system baseplate subunit TssG [Vibrio harveyi]MCG9611751.1 type VI secretion system baseplate subunit TssG [Vibrio harveyi]
MNEVDFFQQLKKRPLFEAIHLIELGLLKGGAQLGSDSLPKNEKVDLKVNSTLGYENAQLSNVHRSGNDRLILETNLIGLTGEQGVLPHHYSELAISRQKEGDGAMVDFYDIFNHRLLSLYYRCWQLSQISVQAHEHSKGARSPLINSLEAVSGHSDHLINHYAGLFASRNRSKGALKTIIEDLTGCDVRLHELQGQWLRLSKEEQTRLGGKSTPEGQFAQVGRGASIGAKAWNINAAVMIELIPTSTEQVSQLLPNNPYINTVKSLVHEYVGKHKSIKWKLTTRHKYLPKVCITKRHGQLGIGTVLSKHKRTEDREITITI